MSLPPHSATIVAHADWSVDPRKRWIAVARRDGDVWRLAAPIAGRSRSARCLSACAMRLRVAPWHSASICRLGCRAPMRRGLPERDFLHFLATTATRPDFFQVCATLAEVGPGRPFYPARGVRGMTRAAHAIALGLEGPAGLSRACDRATAERPAGAPLFWTLGANQSGKAAIAAWQHLLLPALHEIRLWPFAGPYRDAAHAGRDCRSRDLSSRGATASRHSAQGQQAPAVRPGRCRRAGSSMQWKA